MILNDLHIKIAYVLMDCAKNKEVISYSELCEKVDYGSPENMGKVLDPLTKFTYDYCNKIFISVLVVRKDTLKRTIAKPGIKFFEMCRNKAEYTDTSDDEIVLSQRERAYKHDWYNLPDLISSEIGKTNHSYSQ